MATRRDVDQLLVAWLDGEAAGPAPTYLTETLGLLDRVPQRRLSGRVRRAIGVDWPVLPVPRAFVPLALVGLLALALLTALLIIGAERRRAPAIGPAGNGLVAFSDGKDSWLVDPKDTTNRIQLPEVMGNEYVASFSPDGTQLAYASVDPKAGMYGGPPHLFVVPVDLSSEPRRISGAIPMWDHPSTPLSWNTAGTAIVYVGFDAGEGRLGIVVAPTDGSGPRTILLGDARFVQAAPQWSPDGRWISFRDTSDAVPGGGTGLAIVPAEGGERRFLVEVPSEDKSFEYHSWSADSTRIAYERRRTNPTDHGDYVVAFYDLERNVERIVSPDDRWGYIPAWSPDGQFLAYHEVDPAVGGVPDVVIVDRDGMNPRRLGTVLDCEFDWSPDGQFLVGHAPGCQGEIAVVPIDDPAATRTFAAPGLAGWVHWQRVAP